MWAFSVNFNKLAKVNDNPLGENTPNLVTLVGSEPGSSQFHLFSHFHHFTAEPQRLPNFTRLHFSRKLFRYVNCHPISTQKQQIYICLTMAESNLEV
jgi:hypothetical protein